MSKWHLLIQLVHFQVSHPRMDVLKRVINVICIDPNPLEAFYKDSIILITGGNGFVGKVLIEKLLRCFDVEKIYLLIRSKNNESVETRMENFLKEPVSLLGSFSVIVIFLCISWKIFDMLHETNPAVLRKIIPIQVDYDAYDLNIDPEALDRIHGEVQVRL